MTRYEYKVVPAPDRGLKARGVKGPEGRFAHALEVVMNDMGAEGWEYQRAETLPSEERQGLSGRTTVYRNMLVFRRPRLDEAEAYEPRLLDPPKEIPVLDAARALAKDDSVASEGDAADAEWDDAEDMNGEADMSDAEDTASDATEAEDADQPTATEAEDAASDQTKP